MPHWPQPWGLDADPIHQLIIDEELRRAGVAARSTRSASAGPGPTILHAGTEAQKERYLVPLLCGEEFWCQLFSEPGAGSDLANLGTRAVRDGDVYVVNGQKIWTSFAHIAKFGILIARTDPDAPKHQGISYFICPMDLPGIEIRPIVEMTGAHPFNEVFFDDVRIPAENLVGDENRGWALAKVTLGNERVSLSGGGALWGRGPDRRRPDRPGPQGAAACADALAAPAARRALHRVRDPAPHPAAHGDRGACRAGHPGPEASIRKALADEHGQTIMRLAKDLAGAAGMLSDHRPARRGGRLVALRLPLLRRAHGRRRHVRGAAQHHRRARARPSPRRRRRDGQDVGGGARLTRARPASRDTCGLRTRSGGGGRGRPVRRRGAAA